MTRYIALKLINNIFQKAFFTYNELHCKCGCSGFTGKGLNSTFLRKLLLFRAIYGIPFTPRSVYRCLKHKDYSSNHEGHAVDIPYKKNNSNQRMKIVKAAIRANFNRIGISNDFIHIDCNPEYDGTINEEVLWFYPGVCNK